MERGGRVEKEGEVISRRGRVVDMSWKKKENKRRREECQENIKNSLSSRHWIE